MSPRPHNTRPRSRLLLALACLVAGATCCKTTEPISTPEARDRRPVCCAWAHQSGLHYESRECSANQEQDPASCCEHFLSRMPVVGSRLERAYPFACDDAPQATTSSVDLCWGPTRFAEDQPVIGGTLDFFTGVSRFAHVWIRTPDGEFGMGPVAPDRRIDPRDESRLSRSFHAVTDALTLQGLRDRISVQWTRHDGFSRLEGVSCTPLFLCDTDCLAREVEVGKPLGIYTVINQCQRATAAALKKCGCLNHCTAYLPGTNTCVSRIFPRLGGVIGQ